MIVDTKGNELKESFNKKVQREVDTYMRDVANPVVKDVKSQYEFLSTQLHVMTLKYEAVNTCLNETTGFLLKLIEANKVPGQFTNELMEVIDTVEKNLEFIGARNEKEKEAK